MSNLTFRDTSLDKFDKRILLALEDDVLSAKQICSEWAMPDDYAPGCVIEFVSNSDKEKAGWYKFTPTTRPRSHS